MNMMGKPLLVSQINSYVIDSFDFYGGSDVNTVGKTLLISYAAEQQCS